MLSSQRRGCFFLSFQNCALCVARRKRRNTSDRRRTDGAFRRRTRPPPPRDCELKRCGIPLNFESGWRLVSMLYKTIESSNGRARVTVAVLRTLMHRFPQKRTHQATSRARCSRLTSTSASSRSSKNPSRCEPTSKTRRDQPARVCVCVERGSREGASLARGRFSPIPREPTGRGHEPSQDDPEGAPFSSKAASRDDTTSLALVTLALGRRRRRRERRFRARVSSFFDGLVSRSLRRSWRSWRRCWSRTRNRTR